MKNLLIMLLAFGSFSAFAISEKTCTLTCENEYGVSLIRGAYKNTLNAISAERSILFDFITINPRGKRYSNDYVKCIILDKNGEEFYSRDYAVTYLAQYYHSQNQKRERGIISNSIRVRKEEKMKRVMAAQLEECNQNY
jgi:hypothetical protein